MSLASLMTSRPKQVLAQLLSQLRQGGSHEGLLSLAHEANVSPGEVSEYEALLKRREGFRHRVEEGRKAEAEIPAVESDLQKLDDEFKKAKDAYSRQRLPLALKLEGLKAATRKGQSAREDLASSCPCPVLEEEWDATNARLKEAWQELEFQQVLSREAKGRLEDLSGENNRPRWPMRNGVDSEAEAATLKADVAKWSSKLKDAEKAIRTLEAEIAGLNKKCDDIWERRSQW